MVEWKRELRREGRKDLVLHPPGLSFISPELGAHGECSWEGENMAVPRGQRILTGHARLPGEQGVSGERLRLPQPPRLAFLTREAQS